MGLSTIATQPSRSNQAALATLTEGKPTPFEAIGNVIAVEAAMNKTPLFADVKSVPKRLSHLQSLEVQDKVSPDDKLTEEFQARIYGSVAAAEGKPVLIPEDVVEKPISPGIMTPFGTMTSAERLKSIPAAQEMFKSEASTPRYLRDSKNFQWSADKKKRISCRPASYQDLQKRIYGPDKIVDAVPERVIASFCPLEPVPPPSPPVPASPRDVPTPAAAPVPCAGSPAASTAVMAIKPVKTQSLPMPGDGLMPGESVITITPAAGKSSRKPSAMRKKSKRSKSRVPLHKRRVNSARAPPKRKFKFLRKKSGRKVNRRRTQVSPRAKIAPRGKSKSALLGKRDRAVGISLGIWPRQSTVASKK